MTRKACALTLTTLLVAAVLLFGAPTGVSATGSSTAPRGTCRAWGYNGNGQLGDGTNNDSDTPVAVSGLSGVTAVSGGGYHSLALKSDGTVWAWGWNYYGQLGNGTNGTNTDKNTPVEVSGLSGVVAVSAGYCHSLALLGDGTVRAWGYNG